MRVTITGSAGYIGSALWPKLASMGCVLQLVDPKYDKANDITTLQTREEIRDFQPDLVINLAGIGGEKQCKEHTDLAYKVNAQAPRHLRDMVPTAVFIQAGTCSCYDEHWAKSEYATTKRMAENSLLIRRSVVFRFGTLVGCSSTMRWDLPVHKMVWDAVTTGKITIPAQRLDRPWLFLQDLIVRLVHVAREVRRDAFFAEPGPIPMVSQNETLEYMASWVAKYTRAKIVFNEDHKDLRSYSAVAIAQQSTQVGLIIKKLVEAAKK